MADDVGGVSSASVHAIPGLAAEGLTMWGALICGRVGPWIL